MLQCQQSNKKLCPDIYFLIANGILYFRQKYNVDVLIFSCSHVRDVRVGLNRISRPQTVRAEITTGRERLPWKSDFNFCILQKSSVSYVGRPKLHLRDERATTECFLLLFEPVQQTGIGSPLSHGRWLSLQI